MFKEFSKIQYNLNGKTMEFTDIFKSITIDSTNYTDIQQKNNNIRFRPDQFSNEIYQDPNLLWSIFLVNGMRNPFKEWNQSQESIEKQREAENDVYVFQFGNTSAYLPGITNEYFLNTFIDSYEGISFDNIKIGDVLIYETGGGPNKLKTFGCGSFDSGNTCGNPHFGQSNIPDNFLNRNNIVDISAGENFSSCLDNDGRIWAWGENINLLGSGFIKNGNLYNTQNSGYETINATNKIIASTNNEWICFGSGCTSANTTVSESKTISKTSWTRGISFGGVVLFSDKTIKLYGGITGQAGTTDVTGTYDDVSCSSEYCIGITLNSPKAFAYAGKFPTLTGIAGVSSVSCGKHHCIFVGTNQQLQYLINSGQDSASVQFTDTDSWIAAAAGVSFSAAINSSNELKFTGKMLLTVGGSCNAGITSYANIQNTVKGKYEKISVGDNHAMMLGTGDILRYYGSVYAVDDIWKRLYVNLYTAPNKLGVFFDDPNSTNVLVYRGNNLIKSIQHKLLSIDSYINTIQYSIDANNFIENITKDVWKTLIPTKLYWDHTNQPSLITPLKQQIKIIDTRNNIKYITSEQIYLLENKINELLKTDNRINIKLSDL